MSGQEREVTGEYVRCACGKERPVTIDARLGEHMMRRLAEMSACRSCEADAGIALDTCPETIPVPGGISGCSLTWHHQGRCEPYPECLSHPATDGRQS